MHLEHTCLAERSISSSSFKAETCAVRLSTSAVAESFYKTEVLVMYTSKWKTAGELHQSASNEANTALK